jgi:uncharacterized protein YdhG (YjbR/CyaY superfamily)
MRDRRGERRLPEIDAFLETQPPARRDALEHLRSVIAAAAPEAVEAISYGVPAFKYRKRSFVAFGAGAQHCAFYVQSLAVMAVFAGRLSEFDTAKGTIHFAPERPIPDDLVRDIVRARIAETDVALDGR